MSEPEDLTKPSQPQESPYAPPPEIHEVPLAGSRIIGPLLPLPMTLIVVYSAIATALTLVLITSLNYGNGEEYWPLVFASPAIAIAGFVALFFLIMESPGPASTLSLTWKALMVLLVPPASMICFVPTCVGSTITLMPLIEYGLSDWGMAIPFFIAYFVTCLVVAFRLRSRMVQRSQSLEPTYPQIAPSVSADTPFSAPEEKDRP